MCLNAVLSGNLLKLNIVYHLIFIFIWGTVFFQAPSASSQVVVPILLWGVQLSGPCRDGTGNLGVRSIAL